MENQKFFMPFAHNVFVASAVNAYKE